MKHQKQDKNQHDKHKHDYYVNPHDSQHSNPI